MASKKKTEHDLKVEAIRKKMGTLAEQNPEKNYLLGHAVQDLTVELFDHPTNPYRVIVEHITSTWGDAFPGPDNGVANKWLYMSPKYRHKVLIATLTYQAMTTPLEAVNFSFCINGTPRHTFDQAARNRIGAGFCSIGNRDNNKLDAFFQLYPEIWDMMFTDPKYKKQVENWAKVTKDMYEATINHPIKGSWQAGRAFLPMSYCHSWKFYMNLLALRGFITRRTMFCEEAPIVAMSWMLRDEIYKRFPVLTIGMRPGCDRARYCNYSGHPEEKYEYPKRVEARYFSNLFAPCGRHKAEESYCEFPFPCTDKGDLEEAGIKVWSPEVLDLDEKRLANWDTLTPEEKELFYE